MALLDAEVVVGDLRPELHLLDDDLGLLLARLLGPNVLLVFPFAEIHDPDHGGVCLRGDLHQIEVQFFRPSQGRRSRHDSDLLAVVPDNSHLGGPDTVVDPVLSYDRKPLPPREGSIPAIDLPNVHRLPSALRGASGRQHRMKVAPVNALHNKPRTGT